LVLLTLLFFNVYDVVVDVSLDGVYGVVYVVIGIVVLLVVLCMVYLLSVLPVFVNCSCGVVVFYVVDVDVDDVVVVLVVGGVCGCCGD